MEVREIMTGNPICCVPTDTAQQVARILCDNNIGSVPVVEDQRSRKLIGIITDRDLCCAVLANGLDPKSTAIESYYTHGPASCRDTDNLAKCEEVMRERQIRRIPVVDEEGVCIGLVAQADLALKEQPEKFSKTVAEISRPGTKSA
jgi:CBS domain-containing protein